MLVFKFEKRIVLPIIYVKKSFCEMYSSKFLVASQEYELNCFKVYNNKEISIFWLQNFLTQWIML